MPMSGAELPSASHGTTGRGAYLVASRIPIVESELIPWEHMSWRHVRPGHILRFLQSLLTALVLLRSRRFAQIIDRVRRRATRAANNGVSVDVPAVIALLSAFFHIRAFFYAPKARCLLDSLTLLEFLSHYDQHPQWVIGVQITPFGSHSWVQHANLVLNGTAEYVRAYTPILAI
jgi:hypothetical protein